MNEQFYMARAIELSRRGLGLTFPNPVVGAVVVSADGAIIGEGFHSGAEHAEVVALKQCAQYGHETMGAAIFVTLEPCNHTGKTPPCTEAIVSAGISRVVYAVPDPNPMAMGGADNLRSHGIQVSEHVLADESAYMNRAWLHKIAHQRPFIIWKIASTLDGFTAALDGTSRWITSEESRSVVQRMRAESDAILIGTGTALADDPSLIPRNDPRRPLRIVMGERSIPAEAHLNNDEAQTLFIRSRQVEELIDATTRLGLNSILLEAGPTLGSALLLENLVDEIHWFQAPTLLGAGQKAIGDLHVRTLVERRDLRIIESKRIGPDSLTILRPKSEA